MTPEQIKMQDKWRESGIISKQMDDGTLSVNEVAMDSDGHWVKLNEQSLSIKKEIQDGSINEWNVFLATDGQFRYKNEPSEKILLSDQMKGLDSGGKVEKIIEMNSKDKYGLSLIDYDYNDKKQVLGSIDSSDMADLIAYTSTQKDKHLASLLVSYVEPSKLNETAEDLSPQQLGLFIEQGFEFSGDLKGFMGSLSQDQLQALGPYVTVNTMSYLVEYGDPNVVDEIAKGLPEGWREVTEMYHSQAYNIMDLGQKVNRIPYGARYSEIPYLHQSNQVRGLQPSNP